MYQLMVSHNCGASYLRGQKAETLEALEPLMRKLDDQMFRWYVTKDEEELLMPICQVHLDIIALVQFLRG